MSELLKAFVDLLAASSSSPSLLLTIIALCAFGVVGFALYVVLQTVRPKG